MKAILLKSQFSLAICLTLSVLLHSNKSNAQCSQLANFTDVCGNVNSIALSGGTPVGGIYFGPGVSAGAPYSFNPTTAGGPGTYQIGYEGPLCGDTAFKSITVTAVTPADFTDLDTAYCLEDASPVALTAVFPAATGNFGPSGLMTGNNFSIPTVPGWYEVYYFYTNANGCSDTLFKDVRIRPKPTVSFKFNGQSNVCDKDPAFVIDKSLSTPTSGVFAGTGIVGTNIFDPNVSGVGTFKLYYTGIGPFGCENIDSSKFISVNQSPTVSFTLPVDSICFNSPGIALPKGVVNGNSVSGVYTGPGVTPVIPYVFEPQVAGVGTHTIQFEGTGTNGCSNIATRTIKVNPKPQVIFNNTKQVCANDTAFLLNLATPFGGVYSGVGVLPDGITYDPKTAPGPGTYQIFYTVTNSFGCVDTGAGEVILDTFPDVAFTSNPTPAKICLGDTVDLNATSTTSSIVQFIWGPNVGDLSANGGDNIRAFPIETKTITLTANYKGCENAIPVPIQVIQPAVADVSGDFNICYGDSTTLTASGASTYEWSTGELTASITYTPYWDTTFSVIALSEMDGNGKQCSSDTTERLVVVNPLPLISAGLDTTAFIGDVMQLHGYGASTYVWSGATDPAHFNCVECEDPQVTVLPPDDALSIYYYVVGTDSNGCVNNDSILVSIDESVIIFIPTAFSPNSDGVNDSLYVRGKGIKSMTFQVFNRRGEEVFLSKDLNEGWDGTYEGEPMNKEVFVYYLKVTPYIKPPFKQTGSVTLVR